MKMPKNRKNKCTGHNQVDSTPHGLVSAWPLECWKIPPSDSSAQTTDREASIKYQQQQQEKKTGRHLYINYHSTKHLIAYGQKKGRQRILHSGDLKMCTTKKIPAKIRTIFEDAGTSSSI
jgi:hypothetical protein